jgi:hypothetical protein
MLITKLNIIAGAIAGASFLAAVAEEPTELTMADGLQIAEPCYFTTRDTSDGILIEAWASGDYAGSYQMSVTQHFGGGGFDIVQEGDFDSGDGNAYLLSDMTLDVEASFTARLSTWSTDGDKVCDWLDRV